MSANENEMISDIVAEKRNRADEIERDCHDKMKREEMVSDRYSRELVADIRKEADRIEAAWKRERDLIDKRIIVEKSKAAGEGFADCESQKPVGNAAAMREALSDMCYAAMDVFRYFRGTSGKMLEELGKAFDKGKAALAAPPRNCDRFDEMRIIDEFQKQMGDKQSKTADEQDAYMRDNWFLFYKWLFATADEGGAQ